MDFNADRLAEIRKATEAAGLRNVVVIEGDPNGTNLPEGCCDALFTRAVYHHFEDPPAMNASIRAALKPGGRFAVMDFAPDHPQPVTVPPKARASGDTHGVTPDTVVAELTQAGFADAQTMTDWPGGLFLVLVRKPAPNR